MDDNLDDLLKDLIMEEKAQQPATAQVEEETLDNLLDDLMEEAQPGHKAATASAGAGAGRGTGVMPAGAPTKMKTGISSGPGMMKTGISTGPGAKTAANVISSGPGANWRANAPKGRATPVARFTPDGREIKFTGPTCVSCEEMVIGKVLNVNNKPHHPECFTCCECNKSLVGIQFVEKDEQLYCADDYYNVFAPRCYNCKGMIKDKCVSTGMEDQRRTYHPQHFICTGCGTSLVAKNMQYKCDLEGDAFCAPCFGKRLIYHDAEEHPCSMCKKPIVGEYLKIKGQYIHPEHYQCEVCHKQFQGGDCREYEGKFYCFEDYLRMLKKVCAACRKPVVGRSMSALNRVWHPEHFVCAHCHEPFGESNFWEKEGLPYCETHYYMLFGEVCAKCMQAVVVNGIVAMGKVWHKTCFLCVGCEEPMGEKMWTWEDKPYCRGCFNKLPQAVKKQVKQRRAGAAKAAKRRAKLDHQRAKNGELDDELEDAPK